MHKTMISDSRVRSQHNAELMRRVSRDRSDAGAILACLVEHGICIVPGWVAPATADAMRAAGVARAEVPRDTDFDDGSYRRYDCYQGTAAAANKRVYHADCFSPEAAAFKQDAVLAKICADYYGGKDAYSVHVLIYERHEHHPIPVRGFHIDTFETSTFKAFLYLSDVTENDGPTSYVIGTQRDGRLRELKEKVWGPKVSPGDPSNKPHPTNFTEEELGEVLDQHVVVLGGRGTLVLFDTWGVHKGTPAGPRGDRHVLANYYRKGRDLPRSDFGYDVQADYKRYAVEYKRFMPGEGG